MAGILKKTFPGCTICFLGRTYTRDVVALSRFVDEFINYDELQALPDADRIEKLRAASVDIFLHVFPRKDIAKLAKLAGIGLRVGTTNRLYHWYYCNKLIALSRKRSFLHESQLNMRMLNFLGINVLLKLDEIPQFYGFENIPALPDQFGGLTDQSKFNLILHPKSKGSAVEWGTENFKRLITALPGDKFRIFISGTTEEGKLIPEITSDPKIVDLTGKLTLKEFIAFINHCDGLVAASTGPLHIAAALGKKAVGLYVPRRPIHPGRWMPIGEHAGYLVFDRDCLNCKNGKNCDCIGKINPEQIIALLGEK